MRSVTLHEEIYRGKDAVARLADPKLLVLGAGAIGSNLVDNLVRQGIQQVFALDNDRVDAHNVGTQLYGLGDVGKLKVDALYEKIYLATDMEIGPVNTKFAADNGKKHVRNKSLIVDAFDNSASRRLAQEVCRATGVPLLHVGLYENYGEVIWDEHYTVPGDSSGDVCDYPLARNIVGLAVMVASEAVMSFLLDNRRRNFRITLVDMQIREF